MTPAIWMFLAFVAATLGITIWAAKRNTGASAYFAAGRYGIYDFDLNTYNLLPLL